MLTMILTDTYKVSHHAAHVLAVSHDAKALSALVGYLREQFKMKSIEVHSCEQGWFLLYLPFSAVSAETLAKIDNRCTGFLAGWSAKEGAL